MSKVKKLTLAGGLPKKLGQLHKPPSTLFLKGEWDFDRPTIAVVGTRKPSSYGRTVTSQLIQSLARYDIQIVSGLALGVDALAHQAALDNKLSTIAVLPCGIETIYPRTNYQLAKRILDSSGALISEYPGAEKPQKYQFIARNQIIAGLSDAILIPEAGAGSGSLHTAQFALDLGIEVLSVPGPINSEVSIGTNALIKSGARVVTSGLDILEALGIQPHKQSQKKLVFNSKQESQLYEVLCTESMSTDQLQAVCGLSAIELQHALTMLELEDAIRCENGIWSARL